MSKMTQPEANELNYAIQLALTASGGNISVAAESLAISKQTVELRCKKVPQLKKHLAALKNKAALSTVKDAVDREKYKAALQSMQVSIAEAELGARLYQFQLKNSIQALSQLAGGQVKASMMLLSMMERLQNEPYPDEFGPDGTLARSGKRLADEMVLRAQCEYGRRSTEYASMMLVRARSQQILDSMNQNGGVSHGKPGFSPPARQQVLVQTGATAVFNSNNAEKAITNGNGNGEHKEITDESGTNGETGGAGDLKPPE